METWAGLRLHILKVESWTQMGRTSNIIIKYSIRVFASICKNMRILLMGWRYRERCWVIIALSHLFNSLAPGGCGSDFKSKIWKIIIQNGSLGYHSEIALMWLPHKLTNRKSTMVRIMARCHEATSLYLNQCWPRSMLADCITRPQWVNL